MDQTLGSPAEAYERYIVPGIFGPRTAPLVERVRPQPGERILDLACGTGVVTRLVAPMVAPGGSVVALDVSPAMLDIARSTPLPGGAVDVEWVQGNATDIPVPDDDVDVVVCQQGLQFFPDRDRSVSEMHRVLRPGGRVALSVWRSLAHNSVPNALNDAMLARLGVPAGAAPFTLGDEDDLRRMLDDAGFTDISIEEETAPATFESSKLYVDVIVEGGAAVIPALIEMTPEERARARAELHGELADQLAEYETGGVFRFSMSTHIAVARAT